MTLSVGCETCHDTKKVCPATYGGVCFAGNMDPSCSECIREHGIPCRDCADTNPEKLGGPFPPDPDLRSGPEDDWHH